MVLVIGRVFANCTTDEAGGTFLVIMLLYRRHAGVLPDGLGGG